MPGLQVIPKLNCYIVTCMLPGLSRNGRSRVKIVGPVQRNLRRPDRITPPPSSCDIGLSRLPGRNQSPEARIRGRIIHHTGRGATHLADDDTCATGSPRHSAPTSELAEHPF